MTIKKVTEYTGDVADPYGSQSQAEFTQNAFDQFGYLKTFSPDLNSTIDDINTAITNVETSEANSAGSAAAAEAAAVSGGYKGLWPDTGGSAAKGDVWQTQAGGTPTGEYFIALQATTVSPIDDNVNWRVSGAIGKSEISKYTDINYKSDGVNSAVENMIAGNPIAARVGDICSTGNSIWEKISDINGDISDFRALGDICVYDFGAKALGPSFDDYPGILAAVNAINALGGGVLDFPLPLTGKYHVNQYRIDGGPDANGVVNFRFEKVPVKIKGNFSFIQMIGGWTRRNNNSGNSYDNCVGFTFNRCPLVDIENFELDGGCETINFEAPIEGISYGLYYLGCDQILERNVVVSHYTSDGIIYERGFADPGDPYDRVLCKNVVSINTTSKFNGRQAKSIVGLRDGVFINNKYYGTGKSSYTGHAPQASVDIEPSASPSLPVTSDVYTGNIQYHNTLFGQSVGAPLIISGLDRQAIRGFITAHDCTFDGTNSGRSELVANTENFTAYNPTLINCAISPSTGSPNPSVNTFKGGSSEINQNGIRMLQTGVSAEVNIDGMSFDFSPPSVENSNYIVHAGTGVIENCDIFISGVATPTPAARHTAVTASNADAEFKNNSWNTDLSTSGWYSILISGKVFGDKYNNPSKISPTTSPYTQELYSNAKQSAFDVMGNFGYGIFFGSPVNGQSYVRGDTAVIAASAGGKGFNKCTTSGVQGVDAVFKLCGVIDS